MPLPPPSESSTAVVTGASSGIGAEIARELAERGHGRDAGRAPRRTARELAEELGRRARHPRRHDRRPTSPPTTAARDDRDAEGARAAPSRCSSTTRASVAAGRFQELDGESEMQMVRTNVRGGRRTSAPTTCRRWSIARRGALLNVASIAAFQPLPCQATYSAPRRRSSSPSPRRSRADLHGTGVTATSLCPGPGADRVRRGRRASTRADGPIPSFSVLAGGRRAQPRSTALERGKRVGRPGPGHAAPRPRHATRPRARCARRCCGASIR